MNNMKKNNSLLFLFLICGIIFISFYIGYRKGKLDTEREMKSPQDLQYNLDYYKNKPCAGC